MVFDPVGIGNAFEWYPQVLLLTTTIEFYTTLFISLGIAALFVNLFRWIIQEALGFTVFTLRTEVRRDISERRFRASSRGRR